MNILILNWRDIKHPLSGGAEISLFEHAKYWKSEGESVTWFSSSFSLSKKEENLEGIHIIRRGSHLTVHLWAFYYYLRGKFTHVDVVVDSFHFVPFFTPLYFRKVKILALINEIAGKVWFSNLLFPLAFIGYLLEPLLFFLYRNVPFMTGSESTKKELEKLGIRLQNIHVTHHGISQAVTSKKIKKEQKPTIIFLGRISKDKGIEDAIRAISNVKSQIPNITFWIVGKEEKKGLLQKLLKSYQLSLNSDVQYFGYVDEKKKFELLKRAWILIHPSVKEGWGLTVIEAAWCGTPTIGYDVEGLRDSIRHHRTGILVKKDYKAMVEGIITLFRDKAMYNIMCRNAREWSSLFLWEESVKKSYKVLSSI